ncbi:MAG: RNA polymerase II transcription factor B subunit 4 [Trizodia sp. TS-e1964]|nr:MAG: RNA polymerase II transcription factor B subunit 4 [Trizodia sp. TS-e1964]
MDGIDGTKHYEKTSDEAPPSLLIIVLDTNPHAWFQLSKTLPISKAIANVLVFLNAHLAFNYANKVAVIASHCGRASWLYPSPSTSETAHAKKSDRPFQAGEDVEMADVDTPNSKHPKITLRMGKNTSEAQDDSPMNGQNGAPTTDDANKYRPFRLIEDEVMSNLRLLIESTTAADLRDAHSTMMSGALTQALAYISKRTQDFEESGQGGGEAKDGKGSTMGLQSRIIVLSVSGDLALQYIPVMNCIFAAQRKRVPIDIIKIAGSTAFLQQASDATKGVYMSPESPQGILQYLMMGFLPDQTARKHLILPTQVNVDFRAACFCHKKVVDIGFVCSICLSIFCSVPEGAICLTCGTHLQLGDYGGKPAVTIKKKKKRKQKDLDG